MTDSILRLNHNVTRPASAARSSCRRVNRHGPARDAQSRYATLVPSTFPLPSTRCRHRSLPRGAYGSNLLAETAAGAPSLGFLESIELALLLACVGVSGLPLLSGQAKRRNTRTLTQELEEPDAEEDIKWGVMTVVSFIPFVNWTAWVFAAISSEDERAQRRYYVYALLYALPLLLRGLDLDAFIVACLLAGIVHVQVERVANTEAVAVELPPREEVGRAAGQATRALKDTAVAFSDAVEGAREEQQRQEAEHRRAQREHEEQLEASADAELLERWDARLRQQSQLRPGDPRNGNNG